MTYEEIRKKVCRNSANLELYLVHESFLSLKHNYFNFPENHCRSSSLSQSKLRLNAVVKQQHTFPPKNLALNLIKWPKVIAKLWKKREMSYRKEVIEAKVNTRVLLWHTLRAEHIHKKKSHFQKVADTKLVWHASNENCKKKNRIYIHATFNDFNVTIESAKIQSF